MNFKQQIFLKADEDACLPDEKLLNTRVIFLRKKLSDMIFLQSSNNPIPIQAS